MSVVGLVSGWWRPLISGSAAALFFIGSAFSQGVPLAERIKLCSACHGEDGNSKIEKIPSLAGQPDFFVLNQLFLMREGVRKVEAMAPIVKDLKDEDLDALSKHFAKLAPKPSGEPIDAALVKRGSEIAVQKKCVSCHKPNFTGDQQVPRIAKQRIDYLLQALKEFRGSGRPGADTLMSGAVAGLTDDDLVALAHFAASR